MIIRQKQTRKCNILRDTFYTGNPNFELGFLNIFTPPLKVNVNSEGGGGVAKAKVFKEKYGAKFEFPEGWGQTQKSLLEGGLEYAFKNLCKLLEVNHPKKLVFAAEKLRLTNSSCSIKVVHMLSFVVLGPDS